MGLRIAYRGRLVRVDRTRIGDVDARVPDLGQWDSAPFRCGDDFPGDVASALLLRAIDVGALVLPSGIAVECYSSDDSMGGGFVLVAFTREDCRRGVTTGWRDVENVAVKGDDDTESAEAIERALAFYASELNAALGTTVRRRGSARRRANRAGVPEEDD